jgi:hypothetical protein
MPAPDALAAALLQLSEHASRLKRLDNREASHAAETAERIAALTELANSMKHTLEDQAEILAGIKDLGNQLAALTARVDEFAPETDPAAGHGYQPPPAPQFWKLEGPAREAAIVRLRAWVEHVYQPGYGHLAASLGGCWEEHPLCLYALDWLSELWSVLYLQPRRTAGTLVGQAEWQTRLLTAAAEQMAAETGRCEHAMLRRGRTTRIGAAP